MGVVFWVWVAMIRKDRGLYTRANHENSFLETHWKPDCFCILMLPEQRRVYYPLLPLLTDLVLLLQQLLLNLSDNYLNWIQNNTVFPTQKEMDRVGVEPTTSASFSSATTIHLKEYQQHEEILFKSHPVHFGLDCIVFGKQNIHYLFSRYSLFSFFLDSKHNSKLVSSCLFPMKNQMQYNFEHFNSVTISIPKFFPITNAGISNVLGGI